MQMYGVKGFPAEAAVPTVVLKVRAPDPGCETARR